MKEIRTIYIIYIYNFQSPRIPGHRTLLLLGHQAVYGLTHSDDESVMSAGMKALYNVLLRAQYLEGVDHIFSRAVRLTKQKRVVPKRQTCTLLAS